MWPRDRWDSDEEDGGQDRRKRTTSERWSLDRLLGECEVKVLVTRSSVCGVRWWWCQQAWTASTGRGSADWRPPTRLDVSLCQCLALHHVAIHIKWGRVIPWVIATLFVLKKITAGNPKWDISDHLRRQYSQHSPQSFMSQITTDMEKSLNFFGSSPTPSPKLQFEFYECKSKFFR